MRNIRAEDAKVLIGSWLIGANMEDLKRFSPQDFPDDGNLRELYEMIAAGNNALSITKKSNLFDNKSLLDIIDCYYETMYRQVLASEMKRKQIEFIKESVNENTSLEELFEIISDATQRSRDILATDKPDSGYVEMFEENMKAIREQRRMPYGLDTLDYLTGGLHKKDLTVIAARPGCGKSAFALQVANKTQMRKEKVLFFNLEMSTLQDLYRLLMHEGFAEKTELRNGKLPDEKMEYAKQYLSTLEKFNNLHFYEGLNEINRIKSVVRKEKPFLVVIDQLTQLQVAGARFMSTREQMSYETTFLKRMAMECDVCVMLLCQINREGAAAPTIANLKDSGRTEEDADNVVLIHRLGDDEYSGKYCADGVIPVQINLAKQRSGETGDFICGFNQSRLKFYE